MTKTIYFFALAGLMSGCGIYKPYSRPEVMTDGLYREVETTDSTSLATLSWRELFTDEKLQVLIGRGLEQNTDLRIARLRVEQSEASLRSARLAYLPSIAAAPEAGISRYDGVTTKSYNLGVTASWEVDIFGKATNAKRGARAALESSRAYEQAVQTRLVATIAESYYTLLMLDRQLDINEQTRQNWEQTVEKLRVLKKFGDTNDAAVLQARANLMTLDATILTTRKSICEVENSLSALLAMPSRPIERGTLDDQQFPDELAVGLPVQLLANRPDVRQAEYNLAQAFYATNAARAAFYPNLTLSGTIGWTNNGGVVIDPGKWLLNAVGALVQPIFQRGQIRANLKIAESRQKEAALLFQQSVLDAGREVNDALVQWQTAQERLEIGQQQIDVLQEAVRKTELLMRHTPTTYLEVLTAQQTLLQASLTHAQDKFDKIEAVINLYHSVGGGK